MKENDNTSVGSCNYKFVIFDLDGTLLDTIGDLAAAGNHALAEMGLPQHGTEAFKRFVGNGIPKLIERMLPAGHSAQDEERALGIFSSYYGEHKTDLTAPYDGMRELVRELGARGVICTCNTNKAHEFSVALIKQFYGDGIRDVIGAGIGFPTKPSPEAARELMRRYGADARSTLYVGDSDVDMMTARSAGVDACGALWGFRGREELESFHPRRLAENARELRKIILG